MEKARGAAKEKAQKKVDRIKEQLKKLKISRTDRVSGGCSQIFLANFSIKEKNLPYLCILSKTEYWKGRKWSCEAVVKDGIGPKT